MARRASGNPMARLSITLMVIGYGSVLLNYTDIQFILLGWASSMQPWIGLIIGTIGLGILLVPLLMARRGGSITPAQPFQQNYAGPQQPYGTPAQGFPQQQGFQPGFTPQQGFAAQPSPQGFGQQPAAQQGFGQQQGSASQPGFPPQGHPGQPQQYGQQFPPQGYGPQQ